MPWKKVCSLNDLEKDQIAEFDVQGVLVAVVRGENQPVVIPPMCPHLEEPLCEGICDAMCHVVFYGHVMSCEKYLYYNFFSINYIFILELKIVIKLSTKPIL